MKEYIIYYDLTATATNEIYYYETKKYKTKEEALEEYTQDAMNKTTMGIMQMRNAILVEQDEATEKPISLTKIVDNIS